MQKKISKLVVLISMLVMTVAAVGCGGGGGFGGGIPGETPTIDKNDKRVNIYVATDGGGLGTDWLSRAGQRFANANAQTPWGVDADGKEKVGVIITPQPQSAVSIGGDSVTSGTAIYDLSSSKPIAEYVNNGWVLDITDIMTEDVDIRDGKSVSIADKIDDSAKSTYSYNGKYYAAPSVEYYPGLAYKLNLFASEGLYIAKDDNSSYAESFPSEVLGESFLFTKPVTGGVASVQGKSCGPDGVFDTDDDGLPSSFNEFIALCDRMKFKGISPIDFTSQYTYYSNFALTALMASLQGYERAQANYTFKADEIEIVTGFTNENLFKGTGLDSIKKPTTKKVRVTEETGYYTTWSVEKYYAEAFMKLCKAKDWFSSSVTSASSQRDAIYKFVMTGYNPTSTEKIGMHIDGSFWYNEARIAGYLEDLETAMGMGGAYDPAQFGWMSLPVSVDTSVTEGNGKGQTFVEMWQSMFVINANVAKNPALMKASKAFLQFLCTDDELSKYTSLTTVQKSLNYTLTEDDYSEMSGYGKQLWNMTRGNNANKVLYFAGNNETFNGNRDAFSIGYTNNVFAVGTTVFYDYLTNTANQNKTLDEIFKSQAKSKTDWSSMYRGTGTVGDVDGVDKIA